MAGFRLNFQERFEACFTYVYARMLFIRNYFLKDALPSVNIRAYIAKRCAIYFYV